MLFCPRGYSDCAIRLPICPQVKKKKKKTLKSKNDASVG